MHKPSISYSVFRRSCPGSVLVLLAVLLAGCAEKGLIERQSNPDRYEIEGRIADTLDADRFLVIGDTQASWRAEVKFYWRSNWATWKQLAIPFYQIYLLGNGVVGAINWYRQVPDYGGEARTAVRQALHYEIYDRIPAPTTSPAFLLHLGDICAHDGRYPAHWERFVREYARGPESILDAIPMAPVIGNHEYAMDSTYGWPNYESVFEYPRFYVIDLPELAIFVVDSNFLLDQHQFTDDAVQDSLYDRWFVSDPDSDHDAWLERELDRRADRPLKVLAMHHPLVSFALHNRDWYKTSHGDSLLWKRDRLMALMREHNVQAVLSGHEHLYERNTIRFAEGFEPGERLPPPDPGLDRPVESPDSSAYVLQQIISSGAGAAVRPPTTPEEFEQRNARYRSEGLLVRSEIQRSAYHYTRARLTGGSLVFETITVDPDDPENRDLIDRVVLTADSTSSP